MNNSTPAKEAVREFWQERSRGELYAQGKSLRQRVEAQARARYELEPFIHRFARFEEGCGRDVLEIGVGMGADYLEWARHSPRQLVGIDVTEQAVEFTRQRLELYGFRSDLRVGDAEGLPLPDSSFDIVYSWGVLHHSPDTPLAVREVHRVLRPGGVARIMIYHHPSVVGTLLWARYGALQRRSFAEVYANYLESLGTKAYTVQEVTELFREFADVHIAIELSAGDLLTGAAGRRYGGVLLTTALKLWPRWLIRALLPRYGSFMLIEATRHP
ncbi:MAG: class I SAM-dependent methyltransferase [Acidobacteriota bacterium]|nr:class I SAM-dependent methyltransferase [Acidobacteriota bacterium]